MEKKFQLVSNNAGFLRPATVVLSTVKLPAIFISGLDYSYETCLFSHGESEVLERYSSLADAIRGHNCYERIYGLELV